MPTSPVVHGHICRWVTAHLSSLKPRVTQYLLALAEVVDDNGHAKQSFEDLKERSGVGITCLQETKKELPSALVVAVDRKTGKGNRITEYQFNVEMLVCRNPTSKPNTVDVLEQRNTTTPIHKSKSTSTTTSTPSTSLSSLYRPTCRNPTSVGDETKLDSPLDALSPKEQALAQHRALEAERLERLRVCEEAMGIGTSGANERTAA